jgi:hypothetical protein
MDAELDAKIRALKKRQETEADEPGFYSRLKSGITDKAGQLADYAAERGYTNTSAGINTVGSMVADALPNDYKLGDVMAGQIEVGGLNRLPTKNAIKPKRIKNTEPTTWVVGKGTKEVDKNAVADAAMDVAKPSKVNMNDPEVMILYDELLAKHPNLANSPDKFAAALEQLNNARLARRPLNNLDDAIKPRTETRVKDTMEAIRAQPRKVDNTVMTPSIPDEGDVLRAQLEMRKKALKSRASE